MHTQGSCRSNLVMTALDVARKYLELRVREDKGKNRSTYIDLFNRHVGAPLGSPWCASFISYCFRESIDAQGIKFPQTASSQAIKRWAVQTDRLFNDPDRLLDCRGALGGWTLENDPSHGHVFFIAKRLSSMGNVIGVATIEGNTSSAMSRDGDGVYSLIRKGLKNGRLYSSKHNIWFVDTSAVKGGAWWS